MRKVIVIGRVLRINSDIMSDKYSKINTKRLRAEVNDECMLDTSDEKMICMAVAWFVEKYYEELPKNFDPPFEDSYSEMGLIHYLFSAMDESDSMQEYYKTVCEFIGLKSLTAKIVHC